MVNVMAMVGSSICTSGSGRGFSALVTVSPMVMPSTPAIASRSPGRPTVSSTRFNPSNEYSLVMRVECWDPSSLQIATVSPKFSVPSKTRPIASRPR